jgi:cytidylate kinase
MIVTIDGPAGTGKSTVAHLLAGRLGLAFLDTGAMYRALTLLVLEAGVEPEDAIGVESVVGHADVHVDFRENPPCVRVNGRPVDVEIRSAAVTASVSRVASHSSVRHAMVRAQRLIAKLHPDLVTEGRDQGSLVFPEAAIKFYLDASVDIRAARRADQLRKRGEHVDIAALRQAIEARDLSDRSRALGALVQPRDAIVLDTGCLSVEEVVDRLEQLARDRMSALGEDLAGSELVGEPDEKRSGLLGGVLGGVSA